VNRIHNRICASARWQRRVEQDLVPWGIEGVELGGRVLEIGPGLGATTRVLAQRVGSLDVLEVEPGYCERLRTEHGRRVTVTQGDATALPYSNASFSAVLCFTMLHHIPSPELQDRALGEVARVLAPGGMFAGTDSLGTGLLFKLIHIGDTLVPIDPQTMPDRLRAAGLSEPVVDRADGSFRFRARRPAD
jgi:ubiquinone/menaquinone biosynthesis C-methylase UbiE